MKHADVESQERLDSCSDFRFVDEIEIDTAHFKGNFPDKCASSVEVEKGFDVNSAENWKELFFQTKSSSRRHPQIQKKSQRLWSQQLSG